MDGTESLPAPIVAGLEQLGSVIVDIERRSGRPFRGPEEVPPNIPPGVRVLEGAAFGVAAHRDLELLYLNRHLATLCGISLRARAIGKSILALVHPDERSAAEEALRAETQNRTETSLTTLVDARGNPVRSINLSLSIPHDGKVSTLTLFQDAEALLATRDSLQNDEVRHPLLVDSGHDLIVEMDAEGLPIQHSASHRSLLGYGPEDVRQLAPLSLVHPGDRDAVIAQFQSCLAGDPTKPLRYRLRHADTSYRWFEGTAAALDARGGEKHVVLIARDITEQKRHAEELERAVGIRTRELQDANRRLRELQARLTQSEQLRLTEDLAGAVAHSIRNPLTALLGTVEMAVESSAPADPTLERVLGLTKRIRNVVDSTLRLFRRDRMELRPEEPGAILNAVRDEIREQATARSVRLSVETEPDLPKIPADRSLLVSALVSIAENGIDATASGGQLDLEVHSIPGVSAVRFRITDTGTGIPLDLRERVLEPYFTTKKKGTGLGLAIARGVVEGHSGSLFLSEASGGGTVVRVDLPAEPSAQNFVRQ